MLLGKAVRLERIMDRASGRTVIVPMDHGVTLGPIQGLVDMRTMVNFVAEGGANAVLGHVGLPLHGHRRYGRDVGLVLHLSGSTVWSPDPNAKILVNTVENALRMGADAVSVHVNIGAASEMEMLQDLGGVSVKCMEWGVPLLAMMYTRGRKVGDDFTVPLCRKHHRELHDSGNEGAWWHDMGIEPLEIARQLWEEGEKHRRVFAGLDLSDDKPKIRTVPDTPQVSSLKTP